MTGARGEGGVRPISGGTPAPGADRYEVLDALRGFALFGIFLANIRYFSGWEFMGENQRAALGPEPFQFFDWLHVALIDGKFYTLFAFLFGLGFSLQLQRLDERGAAATRIYLRRTTILLLIGLIHLFLIWIGDILTAYALLGFVLLMIRRWSDRSLLIAAALAILFPVIGYALFWWLNIDKSLGLYGLAGSIMTPGAQNPLVNIQLADWGDRLQTSIGGGIFRFGYMLDTWRWPKLFAIMALGMWAGRRLLRGQLLADTRLLVSVLLIGGLCGAIAGPWLASLGGLDVFQPHTVSGFQAVIAYTIAVIPLGLAYAAAFVLLWRVGSGVLKLFAAPGRMALTNYLVQTLISVPVFYGIGLGQAASWRIDQLLMFAVLVYLAQVIVSHFWLKAFYFGPMEWVWRALTYGSAPRFRRTS